MIQDKEMIRRLNLLRSANKFVFKEVGELGEAEVLSLPEIPEFAGIFWVPGTTILKNGRLLESVFRTDTDASGELLSVYWFIEGNWFAHSDSDIETVLGLKRNEVFPFDWTYATKMARDLYHD